MILGVVHNGATFKFYTWYLLRSQNLLFDLIVPHFNHSSSENYNQFCLQKLIYVVFNPHRAFWSYNCFPSKTWSPNVHLFVAMSISATGMWKKSPLWIQSFRVSCWVLYINSFRVWYINLGVGLKRAEPNSRCPHQAGESQSASVRLSLFLGSDTILMLWKVWFLRVACYVRLTRHPSHAVRFIRPPPPLLPLLFCLFSQICVCRKEPRKFASTRFRNKSFDTPSPSMAVSHGLLPVPCGWFHPPPHVFRGSGWAMVVVVWDLFFPQTLSLAFLRWYCFEVRFLDVPHDFFICIK